MVIRNLEPESTVIEIIVVFYVDFDDSLSTLVSQPIFNDSSVILIAQWDGHPESSYTGDTCEAASKVVDQVEVRIKAVIFGAVNMG